MRQSIFFVIYLIILLITTEIASCQFSNKDTLIKYEKRLQALAREEEPDSLFCASYLFWNLYNEDSVTYSRQSYQKFKQLLERKLISYYEKYLIGEWELRAEGSGDGYTIHPIQSLMRILKSKIYFIEEGSCSYTYKYSLKASDWIQPFVLTSVDVLLDNGKGINIKKYPAEFIPFLGKTESGGIVVSALPVTLHGKQKVYLKRTL